MNVVLTHLKTFAEAALLPIKDLTIKLNILLFLTTGQREQTIHKVDINFIQAVPNGKLKSTSPGKHLAPLDLMEFPEEPSLSVTVHLREYLKRTSSYRGENTQLFLSYIKPFKPVSKDTFSRWIKEILKAAGNNTDKYSPHSTRAASTSKCRSKGLQIDEIMKTAGWSNAGTFARFYRKPFDSEEQNFGNTLLKQ